MVSTVAVRPKKPARVAVRKQKRAIHTSAKRAQLKRTSAVTNAKRSVGALTSPEAEVPTLAEFSDLDTIRNAVRQFQSSRRLSADQSPFEGLGQIIKQYGKIPFAAFTFAALASKEIYMIDPGTLNLVNTSIVIFSYYVVLKGGYDKYADSIIDGINGRYQDGMKTSIALLEAGIRHCNATMDKPSVIKEANAAFQEAHEALTEARVRVDAQKHKDGIVNKLNAIYSGEVFEAKQKSDAIRGHASAYLKANALSEKVKTQVLDEALQLVGKRTGAAPDFKILQTVLKEAIAEGQKATAAK